MSSPAIPADPNDRSLLSSIFLAAGSEAYRQARDLWSMTGLPEPQEGEFFSTAHADRVFLNGHGVCLSFVHRHSNPLKSLLSSVTGDSGIIAAPVFEARRLVDERILQPLVQVDLGPDCCFEIVPGVERVGVDKRTVKSFARDLKDDRILFYEPEPEYIGEVRVPASGEAYNLIVNRRSVKPLTTDILDGYLSSAGFQETVYGGLREQFAYAMAQGSGQALSAALVECAAITALPESDSHRILHEHWNGEGPRTNRRMRIAQAASNFAHRMAG